MFSASTLPTMRRAIILMLSLIVAAHAAGWVTFIANATCSSAPTVDQAGWVLAGRSGVCACFTVTNNECTEWAVYNCSSTTGVGAETFTNAQCTGSPARSFTTDVAGCLSLGGVNAGWSRTTMCVNTQLAVESDDFMAMVNNDFDNQSCSLRVSASFLLRDTCVPVHSQEWQKATAIGTTITLWPACYDAACGTCGDAYNYTEGVCYAPDYNVRNYRFNVAVSAANLTSGVTTASSATSTTMPTTTSTTTAATSLAASTTGAAVNATSTTTSAAASLQGKKVLRGALGLAIVCAIMTSLLGTIA